MPERRDRQDIPMLQHSSVSLKHHCPSAGQFYPCASLRLLESVHGQKKYVRLFSCHLVCLPETRDSEFRLLAVVQPFRRLWCSPQAVDHGVPQATNSAPAPVNLPRFPLASSICANDSNIHRNVQIYLPPTWTMLSRSTRRRSNYGASTEPPSRCARIAYD